MPKPKKRQTTPYDTVFDFIFGKYKPPKDKRKPGPPVTMPPMGLMGDLMGQMAMSPIMFPTNQFIGDMDREIDSLLQKKWKISESARGGGVEIKMGPSSFFKLLNNPKGYIDKAYEDYNAGKKIARLGAVTRQMDGVLVALMAKKAGFDAKTAFGMGGGVLASSTSDPQLSAFGYAPSQVSAYNAQQTAITNLSRYGEGEFGGYGISQRELERLIKESSSATLVAGARASYTDKNARRQKLIDELVARGVSAARADDYATKVWGDASSVTDRSTNDTVGDRLGIWLQAGIEDTEEVPDPTRPGSNKKVFKGANFNNDEIIRKRAVESSLLLVDQRLADPGLSASERNRLNSLKNWMRSYTTGNHPWMGLGRRVGTALHFREWWRADIISGKAVSAILWGNASALEGALSVEGLFPNAPHVRKLKEIVDTWHPVNIIKGLTWNGRTWVRMGGYLGKGGSSAGKAAETAFKLIGSLTPQQLFTSQWKKASSAVGIGRLTGKIKAKTKEKLAQFASGILGVAAKDLLGLSVKEILKQVLTKIISQVISKIFSQVVANAVLPGIGIFVGAIVDFAINIAIKLSKPLIELGMLLLFGAVALVLMILFGRGGGQVDRLHRHLNNPINATYVEEVVEPGDWADDSTAPTGLNAACITGGSIACTQGPCGSFSHSGGHRPVDLTWGGMARNPEIVAPSDVRITTARSSLSCGDGTNLGGMLEFEDEAGYRWRMLHVRPVAVVGSIIPAGQPIAEVQFKPEVQSGECWTGPHAHIEIKNPSGQYVDAEEFLNSIGCSFSCGGSSC